MPIPAFAAGDWTQRIVNWVQTPDWSASHQHLRTHPDLLSDEAYIALRAIFQANEPRVRPVLVAHYQLLRDCRSLDIDLAYTLAGKTARKLDEREELILRVLAYLGSHLALEAREYLEEQSWLLDEQLESLVEEIAHDLLGDSEQARRQGDLRLALMRRSRQVGVAVAFAEWAERDSLQAALAYIEPAAWEFARLDRDSDRVAYLADHPELLIERADVVLTAMEQQVADVPGGAGVMASARLRLRLCRVLGVRRALAGSTQRVLELFYEFARTDTWQQADDYLRRHPELADTTNDELFTALAHAQAGDKGRAAVLKHLDYIRQRREAGIAPAPTISPTDTSPLSDEQHNALVEELFEWIQHDGWKLSHAYLREHPDLLTLYAEDILLQFASREHSEALRKHIATHIQIIRLSRRYSIDVVYTSLGLFDATAQNEQPATINAIEQTLAQLDEADPQRGFMLANQGSLILQQAIGTQNISEFDRAIAMLTRATQMLKPGSQGWIAAQLGLGAGLRNRSVLTGNLDDLAQSVAIYQAVLATPGVDSTTQGKLQNNLGLALRERHYVHHNMDDLDAAIAAFNSAIALAHPGAPEWANRQANLGGALLRRAEKTNERTDVDNAVEAFRRALDQERQLTPDTLRWRHDLAETLQLRALLFDRFEDLEEAITISRDLVAAKPSGRFLSSCLTSFGKALTRRFTQRRDPLDLDQAETVLRQALAIVSPGTEEFEHAEAALNRLVEIRLIERLKTVIPTSQRPSHADLAYRDELLQTVVHLRHIRNPLALRLYLEEHAQLFGLTPEGYQDPDATWLVDWIDRLLVELCTAPELDQAAQKQLRDSHALLRHSRAIGLTEAFDNHRDQIKTAIMVSEELERWSPEIREIIAELYARGIPAEQMREAIARDPELQARWEQAQSDMSYDREELPDEVRTLITERNSYSRLADIPQRIEVVRKALSLLDPAQNPWWWAHFQIDLGCSLQDNYEGSRADNMEQAIEAFRRVAEAVSPESDLDRWVAANHNLANVYLQRIKGDPAANIEEAINIHERVKRNITLDTLPPDEQSSLMNSLGSAYRYRILGDSHENQARALDCFQKALSLVTRDRHPSQWAQALNNIGGVQLEMDRHTEAIDCFLKVLEVRTREHAPFHWGRTMLNLGVAYVGLKEGKRADNLHKAIDAYEQALTGLEREMMPYEWASCLHNLAVAYSELHDIDPEIALDRAVQAERLALEVFTPDTFPERHSTTAGFLGQLLVERAEWRAAYHTLQGAITVAESLSATTYTPSSEQSRMRSNLRLFDNMVRVCVELREDPEYARAALCYAEASKARTFLNQMGQIDLPPPPDVPDDVLARERKLLDALRAVEQELARASLDPNTVHTLAEQRRQLREELAETWRLMATAYPSANEYILLRRAAPPSWHDITVLLDALEPDAAWVEFFVLDDQIVVFVVRRDWEAPHITIVPIRRQVLHHRYLLSFGEHFHDERAMRRTTHEWQRLGAELLEPLSNDLKYASIVYLVPHAELHLLPLHALNIAGEPLIARLPVVYAPSAAVLARVIERGEQPANGTPLVVGYTPSSDERERQIFLGEAQWVARHVKSAPLVDAAATGANIRMFAENARLIHLSCHGGFDSDDPLSSALLLADGMFTARDWLSLRLRASLVTLSACQTGMSQTGRSDEIAGFIRSILYAGATSVISTLWSVDALATRDWMQEFYRHALDAQTGQPKLNLPEAFRQATLAVRDRHNDPFFWAPFLLVGS